MITIMKATLVYRDKRVLSDGSIQEIVIWKLPEKTQEQPHGFKYRLYLGLTDGTCLVKYDNEKGKGDHKHLREIEHSYSFTSIVQLMQDFLADVHKVRAGTP